MTVLTSSLLNVHRPDPLSWLTAMAGRGVDALALPSVDRTDSWSAAADASDVQLATGGDGPAFERIVRRHQQEVARRLRRFARDAGTHEELVQETFVQAYFSLHRYRADAPLIHWLHRIAVRVGYAHWRKRAQHRALPLQTDEPARKVGDSSIDLHRVLARLAPRDRLVVTLLHLEDRTVEQVAALTGWSRTMVKVQAFRARRRLRALMEESCRRDTP